MLELMGAGEGSAGEWCGIHASMVNDCHSYDREPTSMPPPHQNASITACRLIAMKVARKTCAISALNQGARCMRKKRVFVGPTTATAGMCIAEHHPTLRHDHGTISSVNASPSNGAYQECLGVFRMASTLIRAVHPRYALN